MLGVDWHMTAYKNILREKVLIAVIMCPNKITKILHAYVQYVYIVKAKHQIAPSNVVVEVDRPMYALSPHNINPI